MNQQVIRNVLLTLSELDLVTTAAGGVYEITDLGQQGSRKTEEKVISSIRKVTKVVSP